MSHKQRVETMESNTLTATRNVRDDILELENALLKVPGAVRGDSDLMPLKHSFAPGMYVRQIFIPKGTILTGKIHRHAHPNFLMSGEVIVVTEERGREHLKAPMSIISAAGTKRAILALEDTVWITVHATEETDLQKIEDYVIAKDFDAIEPADAPKVVQSELTERNCLILALKKLGRDYSCLFTLKADGYLLPFKAAIAKLRECGISTEGLSAEWRPEGIWHVAAAAGRPFESMHINESEMVGSWAAVAIGGAALVGGVAGYMSSSGGNAQTPGADPRLTSLEQEQLNLLQEQDSNNKIYAPLQAENAGYSPVYGNKVSTGKTAQDLMALWTAPYDTTPDANGIVKAPTIDYGGKTFTREDFRTQIYGPALEAAAKADSQITGYSKTPERIAQDKQVADLQSAQLETSKKASSLLSRYLDTLNSDDYKAYQKSQQDLAAQQTQIALLQGERTKRALDGTLPVSQGTVQRKANDFQMLKESMAKSGNAIIGDDPGSAYSLSSPGAQALKDFNTRYGVVEDQERQGALDTGTSSYLQAVGLSGTTGQNAVNTAGQLSAPQGFAATSTSLTQPSPVPNNLPLIQSYGSAMNPYLQQQQLDNSNQQFNAQTANANKAGWLSLAGVGAGMAGGAYANR